MFWSETLTPCVFRFLEWHESLRYLPAILQLQQKFDEVAPGIHREAACFTTTVQNAANMSLSKTSWTASPHFYHRSNLPKSAPTHFRGEPRRRALHAGSCSSGPIARRQVRTAELGKTTLRHEALDAVDVLTTGPRGATGASDRVS